MQTESQRKPEVYKYKFLSQEKSEIFIFAPLPIFLPFHLLAVFRTVGLFANPACFTQCKTQSGLNLGSGVHPDS